MRQPMARLQTSTDPDGNEPTPDIVLRAAEWMAHLESDDVGAADVTAFEAWQAEHPAHAIAIARMGGFDRAPEVEREALRRLFLRAPSHRRLGGAALIVAMLFGVGWMMSHLPTFQLYFADERTAAGDLRAVPLADGSRIVLASNSAANIDMGDGRRVVRLLRGEVLATVAKGQPTRFRVETADGSAEALGTAFTVRKDARATIVSVVSSQVRVCPAVAEAAACLTLSPGDRAQIADGVVSRLTPVAPADIAAWTDGWLSVDKQPLDEVLDALNRWRETPIRFDPQALSGLRVSGVFPLRDTDSALTNLARSQPIMVDHEDPASPVVRRRTGE